MWAGSKIIACEDVSWGGYPDARLRPVDFNGLPSRPRKRVWLPPKPKEPDNIIKIIRLDITKLPTSDWKVIKVKPSSNAVRQAVLTQSKENLSALERRRRKHGYGQVYKNHLNAAQNQLVDVETEEVNVEEEIEEKTERAPLDDTWIPRMTTSHPPHPLALDLTFRQ